MDKVNKILETYDTFKESSNIRIYKSVGKNLLCAWKSPTFSKELIDEKLTREVLK